MSSTVKFPSDHGRTIVVADALNHHKRWKNNLNHKAYPADGFVVSLEHLQALLSDYAISGIKFCNGLNEHGDYYPMIIGVDGHGAFIKAFDHSGVIEVSTCHKASQNWQQRFPLAEGHLSFFYFGANTLRVHIHEFDLNRYEVAFIEKSSGEPSAVLFGFSSSGMKDVLGEADTALISELTCPPACE